MCTPAYVQSNDFDFFFLKIETETCNDNPCPVWTEWTDWTPCTKSCGGGLRKKARECVLPKSEAFKCSDGDSEMIEKCNENTCPSLTPWTDWSECSVTCGGGSQKRIRECLVQRTAIGKYILVSLLGIVQYPCIENCFVLKSEFGFF